MLGECTANDNTTPSTTNTPIVTNEPFTCPHDGYFAHDGQCTNKYYICVELSPYPQVSLTTIIQADSFKFEKKIKQNYLPQVCPGYLLFDPATLKCVPPTDASCMSTQFIFNTSTQMGTVYPMNIA